jgi:hypothetical protein
MIKKIAITGHTSGLGKSFFDLLTQQGHHVCGFSRSNGYDLRDYSVVSKIIKEIEGFDLFINNAKPDYAQSQIVYRLARDWTGTVLSIGSVIVINPPNWTDTFLLEYLTQKTALAHAHQVLEPVSNCKLILVHPEHIQDTQQCALNILESVAL